MNRKRILLILAAVLLLGVVFLAILAGRSRRPEASPSPSPAPSPTATPAPAVLACPPAWVDLPDGDRDGLPDAVEALYLTDEANPDTDGDGFRDGREVRAGYDPLKSVGNPRLDSDDDGLLDPEECRWETDPFTADTDGDGFEDGREVQHGFDPTIRGDGQGSDRLRRTPPQPTPETPDGASPFPAPPPINGFPAPPPVPPIPDGPLNTALPEIPATDIGVGTSDSPQAIRTYLNAVDRRSPLEAYDATEITNAITNSIQGNPAALRTIRSRISSYEQALRGTTVPPAAVEYHRTLLALTRFVNDRFGKLEAAGTNVSEAYRTLRELQAGLNQHIPTLTGERRTLESRARQ